MLVRVSLLGSFRVDIDGREVLASEWKRGRSAALVKLLALSPGHRLHREQAMDALWPDLMIDAASANLRKAVHFARRTLGSHDVIGLDNDVVSLAPHAELEVDADVFEAAATAGLREKNAAHCVRAADLYAGELVPDDRYAAWTEEPRERLRQLYLRALRGGGLWDRLLAVDPTNEEAQRTVMQVALDAGNRGEVIRQFQRLRERLRTDLGVGPAAATVAIYEKALGGQADSSSVADRVRGLLAWGIIHLNSGEFANAEKTANEARELAIDAGLGRETGEASALVGLVAHMQGKWPVLFKSEFSDWIRRSPAFVTNVFDGHLCLAEFCLCGPGGHDAIAAEARQLLGEAISVGSIAGQALSTLILAEGALFSGDLDEAERMLVETDRLFEQVGWTSGRVMALQRLAELAIARGQRWKAARIVQRGFRIAESNWLAPHFLLRLQALAVDTATSRTRAAEAIADGDRWLATGTMCQPCSMAFRVTSSITLAEMGEVEQARRRIDETERLAGMWNGGPWGASIWEARGVQRRAEGNEEQAAALFREAAARYADLGRRGDEARCLERASPTPPASLRKAASRDHTETSAPDRTTAP